MLTDLKHGREHEEVLVKVSSSICAENYMRFLIQEVFRQSLLPTLSSMIFKVLSCVLLEVLPVFVNELACGILTEGEDFVSLHDRDYVVDVVLLI